MNRSACRFAIIALAVTAASAALAGEVSSERQQRLRDLVLQDCGSCHGMTLKGGLGSALTPQQLNEYEAASLAAIILDGVPGKPMPPWRGLLSETEALWIATALKKGAIRQ